MLRSPHGWWDGSSPRVRGTRCPSTSGSAATAVHPRVCGELDWLIDEHGYDVRFIPACAGNSADASAARTAKVGSSPRVRGTRIGRRSTAGQRPVHPRVCGELGFRDGILEMRAGSSPRVRGTPWTCDTMAELEYGSSPRVRGTRTGWFFRGTSGRVHPRVCGELERVVGAASGAPVHPRVCGELPPRVRLALRLRRFIPACAGNSCPAPPRLARSAVHPRVCGELPARRPSGARYSRFIPACAGTRCSR